MAVKPRRKDPTPWTLEAEGDERREKSNLPWPTSTIPVERSSGVEPRTDHGLPASRYVAPSRIVWEHTRGCYLCTQCDFSMASWPTMTLHLQDHRPNTPTDLVPGSLRADARAGKAEECFSMKPEARGEAQAQRPPPQHHTDPISFAPAVSQLSEGERPIFSQF